MAAHAIGLVADGGVLGGGVGLEQRPAPSVAPQGVAGEAALGVLDHHEPHGRIGTPDHRVASGHGAGFELADLFHQRGAVRELAGLAVVLGRGLFGVHIVQAARGGFFVQHRIRAQVDEVCAEVCGAADAALAVHIGRKVAGRGGQRQDQGAGEQRAGEGGFHRVLLYACGDQTATTGKSTVVSAMWLV
ncbi:hypothetical protein D3C85_1328910 [compost metagenome]